MNSKTYDISYQESSSNLSTSSPLFKIVTKRRDTPKDLKQVIYCSLKTIPDSMRITNNTRINQNRESILCAEDQRNETDNFELKKGSIIDSYDIDRIILDKPRNITNNTDYLGPISPDTFMLLERVLSDGSGK